MITQSKWQTQSYCIYTAHELPTAFQTQAQLYIKSFKLTAKN